MDDSQMHLLCKRYQFQKVTNGDSSAVEKAKLSRQRTGWWLSRERRRQFEHKGTAPGNAGGGELFCTLTVVVVIGVYANVKTHGIICLLPHKK